MAQKVFADCFRGDLEAVKSFVSANPQNINDLSADRGCSLLYTASRAGHVEIVRFLVDSGASLDRQNKENASTPLHGAAFGGHWQVVDILLSKGAQMLKNSFGDTPLEDCDNSEAPPKDVKKCKDLLIAGPKVAPPPAAAATPAPVQPTAPTAHREDKDAKKIDIASLSGMTVVQLKDKCRLFGLPATGKKAELIQILKDHCEKEKGGAPAAKKPKPDTDASPPTPSPSSPRPTSGECPVLPEDVEELKSASYTLTEIPKDTEAFWEMEEKFAANLQGRNEDYVQSRLKAKKKPLTFILVKCQKIENEILKKRFERRKALLLADSPESGRERVSFHGSNPKNIPSILKTSLLRFKHPLNPCKEQVDDGYFGTNKKGVYVSRYSDYTYKYANNQEPLEAGQTATVIMFRTLPGKSFHIKKLSGAIDPTPGYHSHSSPSFLEWYLFCEDQLLPEYLLTAKAVEDVRTAADDE
eukprot:TRINITY_DN6708_c0_g2_i2.p1 TRINITY_DN6708_c0_g2~~TRINITY_DN6708_c0_g2_i2.p1  ORF type:complete len:470 (+),score=89.07 TRINITY_DN6708_c0_g2_i2:455-1864(+)